MIIAPVLALMAPVCCICHEERIHDRYPYVCPMHCLEAEIDHRLYMLHSGSIDDEGFCWACGRHSLEGCQCVDRPMGVKFLWESEALEVSTNRPMIHLYQCTEEGESNSIYISFTGRDGYRKAWRFARHIMADITVLTTELGIENPDEQRVIALEIKEVA